MEYLNGIFFNKPNEKAPDFVKGNLKIKVKDFIETLKGSSEEYINLDCLESKEGKYYLKVNTWKPDTKKTDDEVVPF